jgi:UDP-2,4-diacetamido-2,4,6-trideoxy-beta-L-altropyranose hydrolase
MTKVLFRVDAGHGIGSGHMMRCLALAEALGAIGDSTFLLTAPSSPLPKGWSALGTEVHLGVASGLGDVTDLTLTTAVAAELEVDWVVADGYYFASHWLETLGRSRRLLYFDDLGQRDAAAALVLNQNAGAEVRYRAAYRRCQRSLLGLNWFLLGSAWRATHYAPESERLLLTLGGSGSAELMLGLMRALVLGGGRFFADVVITSPAAEAAELISFAKRHAEYFSVHLGPLPLSPLMARAAVVICGGGVTPLEAIALGAVPVILTLAENQVPGSHQLAAADAARVAAADHEGIFAAARLAQALLDDESVRHAMAANGRKLVDSKGADRVVQVMNGDIN